MCILTGKSLEVFWDSCFSQHSFWVKNVKIDCFGEKIIFSAFLAHLSRRLIGELIVYRSSRRPCVHPFVRLSVCPFTLSNMNISATNWLIGMKFYLKHHRGGGKASVGFDPDRIRILVSMATDSSHRVIMGKTASSRFLKCF